MATDNFSILSVLILEDTLAFLKLFYHLFLPLQEEGMQPMVTLSTG